MALGAEQLIEAALKQKLIEADTLNHLRTDARRKRIDLLDAVTAHYRFPVASLYRAAAEMRGLKFVDYAQITPDTELLKKIPQTLVRRKGVLPIALESNLVQHWQYPTLMIALISKLSGACWVCRLQVVVAEPGTLNAAINRAYNDQTQAPTGSAKRRCRGGFGGIAG